MEQLKITTTTRTVGSATSGVAGPMVAEAPRPDVILFACLQAMEAVSACLLSSLRRVAGRRSGRANANSHNCHNAHNATNNFFTSRLSTLLEKQFDQIGKLARFKRPSNKLSASPAECAVTGSKPGGYQTLLSRIDLLEGKLADACIPVPPETDWAPLVKASAVPSTPATTSVTEAARDCSILDEERAGTHAGVDLAGRCVLCIGGRAALYPEYRRVVETLGGSLLIYRRGPQHGGDHLPALLDYADLVVCPVDCVNHYTYFTVKRYCKYSGKPCALLDRSSLPAFRKGIATLAALAVPSSAR